MAKCQTGLFMLFFGDMLNCHAEQSFNVFVIQRIINGLAASAISDDAGLLQCAELMRNCGLRHIQQCGQIADAELSNRQRTDDSCSGGISEGFEEISNFKNILFIRHIRFHKIDGFLMNYIAITAIQLLAVKFHFHIVTSSLFRF